MNKIFKIIWSKARNCYVVVSELAKSHDDGHVRRSRSGCCRKAAVLAAFVLTTSLAVVPVWAADSQGNITNNEASTMTGSNTTNQSKNSVIYGSGNAVDDSENAVVVGKDNKAKTNSVVIGNGAQSNATDQIVIGKGKANGDAIGSIVIGNSEAIANTSQSVIIGNYAKANGSGQGVIVMGNGAMADDYAAGYNDNGKYIPAGIVLGEYSYSNTRAGKDGFLSNKKGDKPSPAFTDEYWNAVWKATANPMAIGNADTDASGKGEGHNGHGVLTRQITGVAAGTDLTDAVNVAQLQAAMAQFSGGGSGTGGDGVHFYSVKETDSSKGNYNNEGATGTDALAAGVDAKATGNYATAVGNNAQALKDNAVAIGNGAVANGTGATVIGQYGTATGSYALAFGGQQTDTTATPANNVASGDNSVAFGERTTASGSNSTAFGQGTKATEKRATAFGQQTQATQSNATAFGINTIASGQNATAFGNLTQATEIGATAFGNKNQATGQYATAWGGGDKVVDNGDGTTTKVGTVASGTYATAFGERTVASGESATAFGSDSTASGKNAAAFGENSTASGEASTAFGIGSTAAAKNSLAALGGTVAESAENAAAIGKGAQAKLADTVALGSGSVADRQSGAKGYDAAIGAETTQTSATWVSNANAIAVGNGSTLTRQITGVAAGSQDTDAVNLAQLKEVGKLAGKHTTVSVGDNKATADDTLVKGGNLELKRYTTGGQANYDVALSKDVVLGEQEEDKGGSLTVNSVAQFRKAPGSKETYPVKEAVKIDGTTVSVVKNDGTNDQRQVVLGIGQDTGGYVALFDNTGKTPTYIFNAISSGITYLKDSQDYPADEANEFKRLEYGDITNGSTQFIATLDDGLKFHGDSGDIVTRKLNTQLDVLGGQTDTNKLTATTDGNIGVVSTKAADENFNGKLEIRLAKKLKGLTSVQAGDTTIDGNGLKIEKAGKDSKDDIIINKTTVSVAGNQITNMGSGIDGTKYTDAGDNNGANIGDVKQIADGRRTTVKSTDGTVSVVDKNANDPNATSHDYDLSVDTSKVAKAVDLKYKGDNNTEGSNKLSDAVTFSGTANQIVTTAENGKVTFKLADDVTTQTITAVGKNGNDGQIGLTGKNGADGSVTTIIKTVGAKGTDGKDGIPGVDGQPGKDGITRLTYDETDDKGGTEHHVVATLDDGLKFVGNDSNVVTRRLNDTLSIKGGIDDKEMLADAQRVSSRNLGVRQNTAKDGLEIVMTNRPDFEAITVGPDGGDPAHKITIGQQDNQTDNPNPAKGNYIKGLDNTQWDAGNVVADRAATEGQLSQAITDISGKDKGGFGLADEKGDTVKKNLGETIAVKGDGKNIETKVNGDALEVSLKKDVDLGQDGSIKAGNTTINSDGVETNKIKVGDITITDQGINGGSKQITNIGSGIDGKQYATVGDNNAASIGDVKKIAGEEAGKAADAVKSKSGKNITVKDDHTVNLNDNITLGNETDASKQVAIDGNGAKVTAGDGANKVTVDGSQGQVTIGSGDKTMTMGKQANTAGDSNPAEGNYLNGLDNTQWDGEHIQNGRAATEDQLKTVSDKVNRGRVFQGDDGQNVTVGMGDTLKIQGGVKAEDVSQENNIGIVKGADDTLNIRLAKDLKGLDSVTTGNTTINNGGLTIKTSDDSRTITVQDGNVNMGGNTISGVADGKVSKDSTDAVNGSQLWQRDQAINGLSGSVNKLGNRINRVGAGAAALAALHPLDFDPDDKWDFAAGYGNYRGANAAAVGAYYRPNEDTMFSVGGSFGGGENMVNAGVSIKLGQGNHVSTSRVAMAKEMKAMRQHMAEQDALIAKLQSMHGMAVDPTKSTLFPDVAENHWAYQYVTTLAKKGILEGYPDGEFKGDRMMTRYEFAAIVYRIVESGVGSTDPELSKLVKEFSPELQYIRIDTIQKDRNGKPTIERVRVISDAK